MIYNYTRCESVIAKIMADLDSDEATLRTSDIKEWIFEAIEKIGAPTLYIKKESGTENIPILKIEDNQVPLPPDMVVLDGVAFSESLNGPWVPMKASTNLLREPTNKKRNDDGAHQPMMYKMITSLSLMYTVNNMKYLRDAVFSGEQPEYFIKPGWLVTNKSKGFIKLIYKAMPVDERGYPLIPDLASYKEAIYWYVTMKLCYPKFMSGKLGGRGVNTAGNVYFDTRQQWNFYRNQAYAEAIMPTADDIENIKNDWHRLIPEFDSENTFFKDINKEQSIYTDYYYGY